MQITTNGHNRELLMWVDLPESYRVENPLDSEDEQYSPRFVKFKNDIYDTQDFVRIESLINPSGMRASFAHTVAADSPLAAWAGIATDSHATATVMRWGTDWDGMTSFESVVMGYAIELSS